MRFTNIQIIGLYLWFCYSGCNAQFTIHNLTSSGNTIDEVRAVKYTSNGNLWVGTASNGVGHFDGTNWEMFDVSTSGFPNNYIRTLYTFGNTVFAGTGFGGVGKYNGSSWSSITKANTSNGLIDDEVLGMAYDQNTLMWFATYNGLSLDSTTKWRTYTTGNSIDMTSNQLSCIAINSQNVKWIGTENSGLLSFNNTQWTSYTTSNSGLPSNAINKIAIASNNTLWIATDNGLAEFDGATWKVYNTSNTPAFNSNVINDVVVDNNGNVYAATNSGLLTRSIVKFWTRTHAGNSNLPENALTCLALNAAQDKLCMGTLNYGLAEGSANLVIGINDGVLEENQVALYPNPVVDELTVSILLDSYQERLMLELSGISGAVLQTKTEDAMAEGSHLIHWNLASIPAGIYVVKIVTSGNGVVIKKIVKY
jgi:ligand-binding sensor domain-containing protein